MKNPFTAKEQLTADTPLLLFTCTMADGTVWNWSSRTITWNGVQYQARVLRQSLFEAQAASDTQVGGVPKLTFELANADSELSEIEAQSGFKGAQLTVQLTFVDVTTGTVTSDPLVVFRGLMNPPELITESTFRLSAINRMSLQRAVLPNVRIQRICPWRFPTTSAQRLEAVDGGPARGRYSPFYACGYSPDQNNGTGNLNGTVPFDSCSYTRSDCEARGMFLTDSTGRPTARFGGIEFVPASILVRGTGQKSYQLSAVQDNEARYNDFVPLVYGTQWVMPDVVFARNDGNLTRTEVLLGMGEIQGVLKVLVNNVEIPQGVSGQNMTATGWYNLITPGARNGAADPNFTDSNGVTQGDPYGSMAYLSIVLPNRINNGTNVPSVQVLMQGLKLLQFDTNANYLGASFSNNPAWILLDVLMRIGYTIDDIDEGSFARAAAYCDEQISAVDPVAGNVQLARFQCDFAINQPTSAGEIIRAIRNGSRICVVLNTAGNLEARVENPIALQQPALPAGSNAQNTFNGGWPAYEFDATSIARNADGSSSVRLSSKGAQDTPNRLSIEFQDSFNQYQQDSLSLADQDDAYLCAQEVAVQWNAVGISNFSQAERMLALGLNRALEGNLFIDFQTSVKGLGILPGDLITVTYAKENLQRTPFRVTKIAPGPNYRTVAITAQLHNDAWYSDTVTGMVGGRGWRSGETNGLPAPVGGPIIDANGNPQLGIIESEITGSDGSAQVQLQVGFAAPANDPGTLAAPLLGLAPVVNAGGGSLAGGVTYYYAVSAMDAGGGESPLSFTAQANVGSTSNANAVTIDGIGLPSGATGFNVYRGMTPQQLLRIASNQPAAISFSDSGLPFQTELPPDPLFDHVNAYWRWELLPETGAAITTSNSIGNGVLQLKTNAYAGAIVRITRGKGAAQELTIASNTADTLTATIPWAIQPDATSWFVVTESSWRFGAKGNTSPLPIDVPERIGAGLHVLARAANVADVEAAYMLSPVTRWVLGQSGALAADSDVPPAPGFGLGISNTGGSVQLAPISFESLANTRSISAGTFTLHYYDEVNGSAPAVLSAPLGIADTSLSFPNVLEAGTLLQVDQEILSVMDSSKAGTLTLARGAHGTTAAAHQQNAPVYLLAQKVVIVPFVKNFFGSPASGDWQSTVQIPNVRIASMALYMTNALGDGAVAFNAYTDTIDNGLRTMSGGQYTFQIGGYLAIQSGAAPDIVVDASRSVRDMYAVVRSAPQGSALILQLNHNRQPYGALTIPAGATTSNVVSGFGLPPLLAGDSLSLDVVSVGIKTPGSDLNVIMRL
jgi:hypothetical protein